MVSGGISIVCYYVYSWLLLGCYYIHSSIVIIVVYVG